LLGEGGKLQLFFKTFTQKFQLKNFKEFPIGSTKDGAFMVGGLLTVATMTWEKGLLKKVPNLDYWVRSHDVQWQLAV
jgi:hypothetical protein